MLSDPCGTPTGVERFDAVLTPRAPYELNTQSGGGVDDRASPTSPRAAATSCCPCPAPGPADAEDVYQDANGGV